MMEWHKKSKRLWTAEHEGRRFRIERREAVGGIGPVIVLEVDRLQREIRREYAQGFTRGAKVVARWISTSDMASDATSTQPSN